MAIGRTEGLIKKLVAETAAVADGLLIKFGTTDDLGTFATAATDNFFGVSKVLGDPASETAAVGEELEVVLSGIAEVRIAGTVTRGDFITSNSVGRGIATTTAGNNYIGMAMRSGVSGDFIPVLIAQGTFAASA